MYHTECYCPLHLSTRAPPKLTSHTLGRMRGSPTKNFWHNITFIKHSQSLENPNPIILIKHNSGDQSHLSVSKQQNKPFYNWQWPFDPALDSNSYALVTKLYSHVASPF